jgi:hypothetical protein
VIGPDGRWCLKKEPTRVANILDEDSGDRRSAGARPEGARVDKSAVDPVINDN